MVEISVIPTIVTAVAQAAIDYSKQPPRELQIQAGGSMAIAGFLITFLVLGIFTVLIRITSLLGEKLELRKTETQKMFVERPAPSLANFSDKIAAAIAVAHVYLREKRATKISLKPPVRHGVDPWVLSERLGSPNLGFYPELGKEDIERKKWR